MLESPVGRGTCIGCNVPHSVLYRDGKTGRSLCASCLKPDMSAGEGFQAMFDTFFSGNETPKPTVDDKNAYEEARQDES